MGILNQILSIPKQLHTFGFVKLKAKSKEPFEKNWQKNPLSLSDIQEWIVQGGNYGVLGGVGGLIIIDCDTEQLATVVRVKHPTTFTIKTGSGKFHFYYLCPEIKKKIILKEGGVHHGEIISHGSQVVGPGSIHPNGCKYQLSNDTEIASITFDEIDDVLSDYLADAKSVKTAKPLGQIIPDGQRNEILTSLAGSLRRRGASFESISAALLSENALKCSPPLDEKEVEAIARSVAKYEPEARENASELEKNYFDTHRSDIGNAERLVYHFGNIIRWANDKRLWFIWDGKRWREDDTIKIISLAKESVRLAAGRVNEVPEYKVKDYLSNISSAHSLPRLRAAIELAKDPKLGISIKGLDVFDQDPYLLNFDNGTLDLQTLEIRPHTKEDFITKLVHFNYNPDALCPRFDQFMREIFLDDEELIQWVQKFIGYCLTGDGREHRIFFAWGKGRNGKTILFAFFLQTFEEYGQKGSPTLLDAKKGERSDLADAVLNGWRFLVVSEVSDSQKLAEGLVKEITGEKQVKARKHYQEHKQVKNPPHLIIYGNSRPKVKGRDLGIWSRIALVPFEAEFTDEKGNRDKFLDKKLALEIEGFIVFCVQGAHQWLKEGLSPDPDKVKIAVDKYKRETDTLLSFLDEKCLKDGAVLLKELFDAYKSSAEADSEYILSKQKLRG